ncbi:MAG: RNA methyltransferase [Rhodocyclales bacterium GT-UBC]|nr:MAG: RNA methyltransferase [Rhodocyclales bacterium GT-UBC]
MKQIQSRDNPFFKLLKRLAESGRERRKCGKTLLDGVHLIQAYEAAVGKVDTLVVAESALHRDEISLLLAGRDAVVLSDVLMRDLGLVDTPSGILAVVAIPSVAARTDLAADVVLLDGVQDPGNVGTLLRTAAASGVQHVLLSPGCASVWAPKVLRAGQGAHFVLKLYEDADLAEFLANYPGTSVVTCLEEAGSLYDTSWSSPLAWIFGAEGKGVRPDLIRAAQLRVRIPMPGAIESLNVGAAAAICLYEALRRRLAAA